VKSSVKARLVSSLKLRRDNGQDVEAYKTSKVLEVLRITVFRRGVEDLSYLARTKLRRSSGSKPREETLRKISKF
jgi:hypothetical protein